MSKALYLLFGGMLILTACSGTSIGPTETQTPNAVETSVALGRQQTETAAVIETAAAETTSTALAIETETAIVEGTALQRASQTAEVKGRIGTATSQADKASPTIEQLFEDGYISSTEGTFTKLDEFDETFTKRDVMGYYPI